MLDTIITKTEPCADRLSIVSLKFNYHGVPRIVDNVRYEDHSNCIIGFEMRKSGKFSYKMKRYIASEIHGDVIRIVPPDRRGPIVGRP